MVMTYLRLVVPDGTAALFLKPSVAAVFPTAWARVVPHLSKKSHVKFTAIYIVSEID